MTNQSTTNAVNLLSSALSSFLPGSDTARLGGQIQPLSVETNIVTLWGLWKAKILEAHYKWKRVDHGSKSDLDTRNISLQKIYGGKGFLALKPGDRVRISAPDKRTFKKLHKQYISWREEMSELIGKEGIVLTLTNENSFDVSLHESGNTYWIHNFALEKIDKFNEQGIWKNDTTFKIDDDVVTELDPGCLSTLQKNSKRTPPILAAPLFQYIGRVIGVYRGEVVVTFDEISYEMLNPAALHRVSDDPSILPRSKARSATKTKGEKEITIGTTVKIHHDIYKVMAALRRTKLGWYWKITQHIGKEFKVVGSQKNGDVVIKLDDFERVTLPRECIVELNESTRRERNKSGGNQKAPPFKCGDIVRFNIHPETLARTLPLFGIPVEFAIIASDFAEVIGFGSEIQATLRFSDGAKLNFDVANLVKADDANAKTAREKMKRNKKMRVGDGVVLCLGPVRLVKRILKTMKEGFENALKENGKLVGYDEAGDAVIEYEDGSLYSIPEEYICAPRQEWKDMKKDEAKVHPWERIVEKPAAVSSVETFILHSVSEALENESGSGQHLAWDSDIARINSNLKKINIRLHGDLQNSEAFIEKFADKISAEDTIDIQKKSELSVCFLHGSVFYEMKFETGDSKGNSASEFASYKHPLPGFFQRQMSLNGGVLESSASGNFAPNRLNPAPVMPAAAGTVNVPIPAGTQQVILQLTASQDGARGPASQRQNNVAAAPQPVPHAIPQINPNAHNNTFHIYNQQGTTFNLDNCRVREINMDAADENNA